MYYLHRGSYRLVCRHWYFGWGDGELGVLLLSSTCVTLRLLRNAAKFGTVLIPLSSSSVLTHECNCKT